MSNAYMTCESTTYTCMLSALQDKQAFPFSDENDGKLTIQQTHLSAVILTPEHVYKLKKPKNLGFVNYTSLVARRYFCQQEVILNAPLAPDIYLGVAPILQGPVGSFYFGPVFPVATVPFPGEGYSGSAIVDYAVVMRRLPDKATLGALIKAHQASPDHMYSIARTVASFHRGTPTDQRIARFGSLEVIRHNWEEIFEQIRPYIGRALDQRTYDLLQHYAFQWMKEQVLLIQQRVKQGHIRDCHGDLRPEHIYILPAQSDSTSWRVVLLDRIEFNERFRYGDTASEIAFLVMELLIVHRQDLAHAFLTHYYAENPGNDLALLLPFYTCYRACVRGKVLSFLIDDSSVPEHQRSHARQAASEHFKVAARCAHSSHSCGDFLQEEGGSRTR